MCMYLLLVFFFSSSENSWSKAKTPLRKGCASELHDWKWATLRARFCLLLQDVAKCVRAADNPSSAYVGQSSLIKWMTVIMSTVSLCRQQMTYSNYIKKNKKLSVKALIAVAPTGAIQRHGRQSVGQSYHIRMWFLRPLLNQVTSFWQTKDLMLVMR